VQVLCPTCGRFRSALEIPSNVVTLVCNYDFTAKRQVNWDRRQFPLSLSWTDEYICFLMMQQ
jgi:hypothetical protein